jgi:preprotein translocase subunit SecA
MYSHVLRPGATLGSYPEKEPAPSGKIDQAIHAASGLAHRVSNHSLYRAKRFVSQVNECSKQLHALDDGAFAQSVLTLRQRLVHQGLHEPFTAQSFAMVREAAHRTLEMRHYDTQIMGGWVLLNGMLAEMETGDGKTLVATLPACTAALAGIPVHIVTANDYLVERDAELMAPVFHMFGLTVGAVTENVADPNQRRQAYGCDITYCTSKQVAFDYLRDRVVLGRRRGRLARQLDRLRAGDGVDREVLLRGLCFAIVDEADSVLIDQARTPLILSQSVAEKPQSQTYQSALTLAAQLHNNRDFKLRHRFREVDLTRSGNARLEQGCRDLGDLWQDQRRREPLIQQALCALHLYHKDRDYLVHDGKVQIIDSNTGRILPDHSWELGLQQLIEVKEGCDVTPRKRTLARTSYQRFFRRYLRLSGMTGTAVEVARELWSLYGLQVVRIPTHRPVRRQRGTNQVHATAAGKWTAVVARAKQLHTDGRPVLLGTRSVAASEHLSKLLSDAGLPHEVLNARQDRREAEIIANAGTRGALTVATNMAGRGTDIRLGHGVAARGGLHVIATERNEARRIDRQLFGRCGRQGDPGCYEVIASLEDELLAAALPWTILKTIRYLRKQHLPVRSGWLMDVAQRIAEHRDARMRRNLVKFDEQTRQMLAFTGPLE